MDPDSAHKSWWQISEIVFGIPLLIAIALQVSVPFAFLGAVLRIVIIPVGVAFIILGIMLITFARQEFVKHDQRTDPGHPTTDIITTGVFSISRNPIYLGASCLVLGIALGFDLPWVLLLLIPALVACHYILIAPEEKYLAEKFGEDYQSYVASVHRWIGRARK